MRNCSLLWSESVPAQGAGSGGSIHSCTSRQQGDSTCSPQKAHRFFILSTDSCVQRERQQWARPGMFASGEYLIMYIFWCLLYHFFRLMIFFPTRIGSRLKNYIICTHKHMCARIHTHTQSNTKIVNLLIDNSLFWSRMDYNLFFYIRFLGMIFFILMSNMQV